MKTVKYKVGIKRIGDRKEPDISKEIMDGYSSASFSYFDDYCIVCAIVKDTYKTDKEDKIKVPDPLTDLKYKLVFDVAKRNLDRANGIIVEGPIVKEKVK